MWSSDPHWGSLNSGHYVSEVRIGNQWWKCNDTSITKTDVQHLSKGGYGENYRDSKRFKKRRLGPVPL